MVFDSFDYFAEGISKNKFIKILGFRYLADYQLAKLQETFSNNTTVYHLQIIFENRKFTLEDIETGINSTKVPSTPQASFPMSFLSQNKSIATFTIGGHQERSSIISGIIRNSSIKTLILENIDIERNLRAD